MAFSTSFAANGQFAEAGARVGRAPYQAPQRCVSRTPSPALPMAWGPPAVEAKPTKTSNRRAMANKPLSASQVLSTLPPQITVQPTAPQQAYHYEQEASTPRGAVTTPFRMPTEPAAQAGPRGRSQKKAWGRDRIVSRTPSPASPPMMAEKKEVMKLNLTDFVMPSSSYCNEHEVSTPRGAVTTPFQTKSSEEYMCVTCVAPQPPQLPQPQQPTRLWADIIDDDVADAEQKDAEKTGMPASEAPSRGSVGHPYTCSDACKYAMKKRGCKDGIECDHCHLCEWNRYVVRGRVRASTRQGDASAEATPTSAGDATPKSGESTA